MPELVALHVRTLSLESQPSIHYYFLPSLHATTYIHTIPRSSSSNNNNNNNSRSSKRGRGEKELKRSTAIERAGEETVVGPGPPRACLLPAPIREEALPLEPTPHPSLIFDTYVLPAAAARRDSQQRAAARPACVRAEEDGDGDGDGGGGRSGADQERIC